MLIRLLNRLFRREEINGHGRCPTYLYRWTLLRLCGYGLYLHRFVGEDWSRDLHDHPKRFVSLMLWGSYVETTAAGDREYTAPFLRSFPASHAHRLRLGRHRECWTLVLVCRASRPWGFWHSGRWIGWREYVHGGSAHIADRRAVCAGVESRKGV
jgi:hypothetical protein